MGAVETMMTDENKALHVDDDWKAEARKEKERLADVEAPGEAMPDASFVGLIELLAMQAIVGLGGLVGPDGQRVPPNLGAAKHFIDILQLLVEKTRNNLTDVEKRTLEGVLYDLRMRFVEMTTGVPPGAAPAGAGPAS